VRRSDCHDRIKDVMRSYQGALQTANVLLGIVEQRPQYLHDHHLDLAELRALAQELHNPYFIWMFACFESDLRHYWQAKIKNTKPSTERLISSIAARRQVPQVTQDAVHKIREYRNSLVHEQHDITRAFTMHEASRHLNTYIARLPPAW
jgi:hypothetical protein